MSAIVKDEYALIDASQLKGDEQDVDALRKNGKTHRPAPIAPDAFYEMLKTGVEKETIKFTNKGDVDVVARIYESAFLDEMKAATALYYPSLGWGDEEIKMLSTALTFAHDKGALDHLTVRWLPTALYPCPETWHAHSPDPEILFDVQYAGAWA